MKHTVAIDQTPAGINLRVVFDVSCNDYREAGELAERILKAVAFVNAASSKAGPSTGMTIDTTPRAPFTGMPLPTPPQEPLAPPRIFARGTERAVVRSSPMKNLLGKNKNKRWDDDADMFLMEHYGWMKTAKIAANLGRTSDAINARASSLREKGYPVPMLREEVSKRARSNRLAKLDAAPSAVSDGNQLSLD